MRKEKLAGAKQPDGKKKELEVEGERTQLEREVYWNGEEDGAGYFMPE